MGLSKREIDAIMEEFEALLDEPFRDTPPKFMKCTCDLDALMRVGCKCGAIDKEREEKRKREAELDRKIKEDLNKGVPYDERVRRYGRG